MCSQEHKVLRRRDLPQLQGARRVNRLGLSGWACTFVVDPQQLHGRGRIVGHGDQARDVAVQARAGERGPARRGRAGPGAAQARHLPRAARGSVPAAARLRNDSCLGSCNPAATARQRVCQICLLH